MSSSTEQDENISSMDESMRDPNSVARAAARPVSRVGATRRVTDQVRNSTAPVTPAGMSQDVVTPSAAAEEHTEDHTNKSVARRRTRINIDMEETSVTQFALRSLFPRMKFLTPIAGRDPLEYSLDRRSVCYSCLEDCDMLNADNRLAFWEKAKPVIEDKLKAKRNTIQSEMQKEWMSECLFNDRCNVCICVTCVLKFFIIVVKQRCSGTMRRTICKSLTT